MLDQEDTLPYHITPSELFDAAAKHFQASMANKRFDFQRKGTTGLTTDDEIAWADLRIVTWPHCHLAITVQTVPNGLEIEVKFVGDMAEMTSGERIDLEDAWSRFLRYLPVEQHRSVEPADEKDCLPSVEVMRQYYKDYSEETAKYILKKLPRAQVIYKKDGGHWGPTVIAKEVGYSREVVSRYLNALKRAGIDHWKGVPLSKTPSQLR